MDESRRTTYKTKKVSCDVEYSLAFARNDGTSNEKFDGSQILECPQLIPYTTITIFIAPEHEDCLTISSSSLLEDHQEDSGIENNYRCGSIDGHSPATSLDFFPPVQLNQQDPTNPSPPPLLHSSRIPHSHHHHHHQRNHQSALHSTPPFFSKSFTNSTSFSDDKGENDRETASRISSFPIDAITKTVLQNNPEQSYSRSVTPQADCYQQYLSESSDSDNDFPPPPDSLLRAEPAAQFHPTTIMSSNVKSNYSSNGAPPTLKRESLSPLARNRTADNPDDAASLGIELCREQSANITAVKFPVKRQVSAACHSCKAATGDANGIPPNEVDPISKLPKQVPSV
ncbi:unnamed protein product [Gongylonema pulchrum]|uniref:Uncharacterized protein n=1 Tax=Gongylonema pulchrum TaxID=637853 RepID=A0A183CXU3_9BILA|nr:unnamed protein product [Gongylonema pulchrum]